MQIFKSLLVVCVAIFALSVHGADSEAQRKARQALEKKLNDLQAQPTAPVAPPAQVIPPAAAQPAQPAPVAAEATPPPATAPPAVAAEPAPPAASPAQPAVTPPAEPAPSAPAAAQPASPQASAVPPSTDPETIAKARAEMRKKMDELATQMPPETVSPPGPESSHAAKPARPSRTTLASLPRIEGPALPISADKQQRLSALLQRYKADQITPDQYQAERAKILADQ